MSGKNYPCTVDRYRTKAAHMPRYFEVEVEIGNVGSNIEVGIQRFFQWAYRQKDPKSVHSSCWAKNGPRKQARKLN